MEKILFNVCFLLLSFSTWAQSYLPVVGSMDTLTVFDFSQYWLTVADTQVFYTSPDIVIRAWGKWDTDGTKPSDYNFNVVSEYHQRHIVFMGSNTATVYFFDEAPDSAVFKDMVTRDASNQLVPHNIVGNGAYRGNIANPAYRDYVVNIAKMQIDGGVDGIFYDEVLSGYDGATYNGNEGFDDYTIKDFNAYLAAKYPSYMQADWVNKFGMSDTNYINTSQPLNDLNNNFNYREYLAVHGWQNDPLTPSNPLAAEWGRVLDNRADTTSNTFLAKYTTMYWRDMVSQTRQYARDTYGKEILITSNGLLPYVDFNSLGMYNYNHDNNGSEAEYVPVSSGHLNGSFSLQNVFQSLYQRSGALSGSAPVVLFIDWPTQMMTDYNNLPLKEKEDYWKIYGAEAYANGLFIAFHLRTSIPSDPTAASEGILSFLKDYPKFYKRNASFYHYNQMLSKVVSVSEANINSSLMSQPDSGRYTIHLVNHNYISGTGMTKKSGLTVSLRLDSLPKSIYMKSPDFSGCRVLSSDYSGGTLTISVDSLNYYDVIVLDYVNTVSGIVNPITIVNNDLKVFPNPSSGSITIQPSAGSSFNGSSVGIYDETGRSVKNVLLNERPVQLNLPTGIYYLKWSDGGGYRVKKLVVL